MHSDEKDSLTKLIRDVESAEEEGCCVYFGRKRCFSCAGCPAKDVDDPCDDIVYRELARRLHALMPHDADGREIQAGDTIESMGGRKMRITGIMPLPVTILDGESLDVASEPCFWRVMELDSWEKLDADSQMSPSDYWRSKNPDSTRYGYDAVVGMTADLVRRAKRLAGVEQ